MKLFLIVLFLAHASIAGEKIPCPKGSFSMEFKSSISKTTTVFCNQNKNGTYVKIGKEYTVLPSGELRLLKDHSPEIQSKDLSTVSGPVGAASSSTAKSLSGAYQGDFDGACSDLSIDGHFQVTVDSKNVVDGSFKSDTSSLPFPIGGPISGKVSDAGVFQASGKAILDCRWIGQINLATQPFTASGTWKCSMGGADACGGKWSGAKQ